jgi:hypothetical protein
MQAPCYKCTERSPACHDECSKYQAYKDHRQGINNARARQNFLQDYFRDTINKAEKQRKLHA